MEQVDEPKTQTETQNSNLTFEKDECAKEYEELGLKELKELIEADRKTEPTISKMEQVEDEPQKLDCRNKKYYSSCEYANKCHPPVCFKALDEFKEKLKDEPQTERSE